MSKQFPIQKGPGLKPPSTPRSESAPNGSPSTQPGGAGGSSQSHSRGKQGRG
jgi:hypothetical protein